MSSRNSRIVRNRERSKDGFEWNSINIKIVASIAIIVLIIAVVIIVKFTKKADKIQNIEDNAIMSYEYFVLSAGDNVGVIDKTGKKIIEAKYQNVLIPNPQKDVFLCYIDDEKYEILNKEGQKIFSDFDQVETIYTLSDTDEMEKNVLKYKKDGKYGLINLDGQVITEAIYDQIDTVMDKPGSILVKKDNKYGVLDSN